jgi:hypothetical protein
MVSKTRSMRTKVPFEKLPNEAHISAETILELLLPDTSAAGFDRDLKKGLYPAPRLLPGGRKRYWRVGDWRSWASSIGAAK